VWLSSTHAASTVEKGFRIVQVPSDYFYLVRPLFVALTRSDLQFDRIVELVERMDQICESYEAGINQECLAHT